MDNIAYQKRMEWIKSLKKGDKILYHDTEVVEIEEVQYEYGPNMNFWPNKFILGFLFNLDIRLLDWFIFWYDRKLRSKKIKYISEIIDGYAIGPNGSMHSLYNCCDPYKEEVVTDAN